MLRSCVGHAHSHGGSSHSHAHGHSHKKPSSSAVVQSSLQPDTIPNDDSLQLFSNPSPDILNSKNSSLTHASLRRDNENFVSVELNLESSKTQDLNQKSHKDDPPKALNSSQVKYIPYQQLSSIKKNIRFQMICLEFLISTRYFRR